MARHSSQPERALAERTESNREVRAYVFESALLALPRICRRMLVHVLHLVYFGLLSDEVGIGLKVEENK